MGIRIGLSLGSSMWLPLQFLGCVSSRQMAKPGFMLPRILGNALNLLRGSGDSEQEWFDGLLFEL